MKQASKQPSRQALKASHQTLKASFSPSGSQVRFKTTTPEQWQDHYGVTYQQAVELTKLHIQRQREIIDSGILPIPPKS